MAAKQETSEDESFIILGTSPGTSLDLKCNGIDGQFIRGVLDDAIQDLSSEANSAFKAHFNDDGVIRPSPTSLMVASTMITDDKSIEDLQKSFGEILDENIILKETLQKNNESMKEQFLLIASCQEDMMKTHLMHKEKFDETRDLIEKLRQDNKKLKLELTKLVESEPKSLGSHQESSQPESGPPESGPPSALEFVTSPDDDTINKLTAQLELVEKQRRQVIVDNEKLTWQKESLEHIVDATTKERDDLKEKLKKLELQLSSMENEYTEKINLLNFTIQDLNDKLKSAKQSMTSLSTEVLSQRDEIIQQLESKVSSLQNDLKTAQLRILELETVKLEFSKYKSGVAESVKLYKDQVHDLQNRIKEAHTTVFQPVRLSISSEGDSASSNPEYAMFIANVKLYDKTLKHLAELLNLVTHGSVDSLVECLGVVASLHDFKLDKTNVDNVKSSLAELRLRLDKQHATALNNISQVRSTLSILEGVFEDYKEVLKKVMEKPEVPKPAPPPENVAQLTAALVARGQEVSNLQSEVVALNAAKEDAQLLRAQLDLYKSDFEAEREAREKMASEKENILADLRTTQRRIQELMLQLEEVRKLNPNIFRSATTKKFALNSGAPRPQSQAANRGPQSQGPSGGSQSQRPTGTRRQSAPGTTTGNMVYTCPKCMRFSSDQYKVMEDHFDFCLDDF